MLLITEKLLLVKLFLLRLAPRLLLAC